MNEDKKLAVIQQLCEETQPIPLQNLLRKLGKEYSARTVRRWLAEAAQEGLVEKLMNRRAAKYQATQRAVPRKINGASCFGPESIQALKYLKLPLTQRRSIGYDDSWFEAYEPNHTFYIPPNYRAQLHKAGKRSEEGSPSGSYAHRILDRLLIDLSYNSSRLEGNTYSLFETKQLILDGIDAKNKPDEEKTMILNHKYAIRYLVDTAPQLEISLNTVCSLHYLLADGLLDFKYTGKIRDHGVRIGHSSYMPSSDPQRLQRQLEQIVKKATQIEDPYEQSLFLLIHIAYLQAFSDVNKRTSRLSANIPLIKHNLVPLSFNDIETNDYAAAMIAVYEVQDVRPIVDLYAFSYMRTCAMYDSTIEKLAVDAVRITYRPHRHNLIREIITNGLVSSSMRNYISSEAKKFVPEEDREAFMEDVYEDLDAMNKLRVGAFKITLAEFEAWHQKYRTP